MILPYKFSIPTHLNAGSPPEKRGIRRDFVKLMVLNKSTGKTEHQLFYQLDEYLNEGDMIILNQSRTIPALLRGVCKRNGVILQENCETRLARKKSENQWEAIISETGLKKGDEIIFSNKLSGTVVQESPSTPFITLQFSMKNKEFYDEIYKIGEPIRYEYINTPWGLEDYQTVFATQPGSVEMPSAGRAFTWELIQKLKRKGVHISFISLHTGLSYFLDDKWDHSPDKNVEEYYVPRRIIEQIKQTRKAGNKVIAVGTTVVRAIETALKTGDLSGWTNLYIKKGHKLKGIDGIITGFHEPEASHLQLLSAFIDENKLLKAYEEAIHYKYLWHEFGDMNLII